MRLVPGTLAPDFEARDHRGANIRLSELRGSPVLLSFYRYASCPLCNLRVRELTLAREELGTLGLHMLAVFQSTPDHISEYAGNQQPPFPLLADPAMALYRRYGVERDWLGLLHPATLLTGWKALRAGFRPGAIDGPFDRMPADFLIDAEGRIAIAYYARDPGDHLPLPQLRVRLAGSSCPQPAQPLLGASAPCREPKGERRPPPRCAGR
jgi:peroxiredoxin Q/BCP